jgi:hypothetical protein
MLKIRQNSKSPRMLYSIMALPFPRASLLEPVREASEVEIAETLGDRSERPRLRCLPNTLPVLPLPYPDVRPPCDGGARASEPASTPRPSDVIPLARIDFGPGASAVGILRIQSKQSGLERIVGELLSQKSKVWNRNYLQSHACRLGRQEIRQIPHSLVVQSWHLEYSLVSSGEPRAVEPLGPWQVPRSELSKERVLPLQCPARPGMTEPLRKWPLSPRLRVPLPGPQQITES